MAHDVFITYSAKDKTIADAVCATLETEGIRCWIAPRDLAPGTEEGEHVTAAIRESRIMVLVFTAHANAASHIVSEVEQALNHGVTVLPFRVENVLPTNGLKYFIENLHWLDALTPPLEAHLEHLAGTVKEQLKLAQSPETPEQRVIERAWRVAIEPELPKRGRKGVPVWAWGGAAALAFALIAFFAAQRIWHPPVPVSTRPGVTTPAMPCPPAPAPAAWQRLKAMPVTHLGNGVGTANGIIYLAGGGRWFNGQNHPITVVGDLWVYDPSTGSWSEKAAMPTARAYPSVASVNGILYVAGGCADWDCGQPLKAVEAYNAATNTWKKVAPMRSARRASDFLVAASGKLYAVGGMQGTGCSFTTSVEVYDPSTNEWTELPSLPESQNGAAMDVIGNVIYVSGGNDCNHGDAIVGNTEAYDIQTGSWSTLSSLPVPVSNAAYGVIGGKLFVVGGWTATGTTTSTRVFDPVTDAWGSSVPVPAPLNGGAYGAVVKGVLYIEGTNVNAAGVYSSVNDAFTPGSDTK